VPLETVDRESVLFTVDGADLIGVELVGHFLFPILLKADLEV